MRDARDLLDVDLSFVDPHEHFFGRSDHVWSSPFDDVDEPTESPILLGCTCGIDACSPLPAEISVSDTSVTWSFAAVPEGRGLRIGPFEFSLLAYRRQVEGLVKDA